MTSHNDRPPLRRAASLAPARISRDEDALFAPRPANATRPLAPEVRGQGHVAGKKEASRCAQRHRAGTMDQHRPGFARGCCRSWHPSCGAISSRSRHGERHRRDRKWRRRVLATNSARSGFGSDASRRRERCRAQHDATDLHGILDAMTPTGGRDGERLSPLLFALALG